MSACVICVHFVQYMQHRKRRETNPSGTMPWNETIKQYKIWFRCAHFLYSLIFFSQRIYRYLLLLLLLSSLLLYSLSPSSHYKHTTKASMFAHIFYFFSRRFNRGKIGFMIFQWYLLDPLPTSNIIIPCTINNYIFIMTITYILISAYFLLTNKHFNKSLRISD